MKELRIFYFAPLRHIAGTGEETRTSAADTPRQLYGELAHQYGFTVPTEKLRVYLNGELAGWNVELREGDEVTFLPVTVVPGKETPVPE